MCIRDRDTKGIARFLGMINYFHKYIPHLADIAAPVSYTHLDVYKRQHIHITHINIIGNIIHTYNI